MAMETEIATSKNKKKYCAPSAPVHSHANIISETEEHNELV
jgi:hypothetical protein